MRKLLFLIFSIAVIFTLSVPAIAAETTKDIGIRIGYVDYELDELIEQESIAPMASASKEETAGTVTARLFNYGTGTVVGRSADFTFTGLPSNAKITNIQAWNPSSSNISQGRFTAIENIQVLRNGIGSGFFRFLVISAPTTTYPCNTIAFNGQDASATYAIEIQGRVLSNESGMDGFTVRGTKVRVTYTY